MRILHIITGLGVGGAETMLVRLVEALKSRSIDNRVVALRSPDALAPELHRLGVRVTIAKMDSPFQFARVKRALTTNIEDWEPDIIHGWMYHGNLAALYSKCLLDCPTVIWGVRQGLYELDKEKWLTRVVIRVGALLASKPCAVVYNSAIARQQHRDLGYRARLDAVILNGVAPDRFRSDPGAREKVRRDEFHCAEGSVCVGMVARLNHLKGHAVFLRAVELIARQNSSAHFVVVGRGCEWDAPPFATIPPESVLRKRLSLLGERRDVVKVLSGVDVFVLPSVGEGFPNALAEAMCMELPAIASDVGECGSMLGSSEWIVPPGDATALAEAIARMLALENSARAAIGARNRQRIVDNYSIDRVADQYLDLYRRCVASQTE